MEYDKINDLEQTIRLLNPNATFTILDNKIIDWECPNEKNPPTWQEVVNFQTSYTEQSNLKINPS